MMKAVILAGGFGTRLYPLTQTLPKPMAPVLGEPALGHIITLLCKNGVYDAVLTLKYMPESIMNAFNDCYCGVNLKYCTEDVPLGTAGGVKNAAELLDGDIIVVSGDCICDFDLRSAYEYHKNKNAHLTVLLKKVADPLSFGTALCAPDGRIIGFAEKPSWSEVRSNAVNTGIYIFNKNLLDLIPKNTFYDFSKDFFPYLLERDFRVYGYECEGDWCDIGSLEEYRKCNIEALSGKYSLFSSVKPRHGCYDCALAPSARLGEGTECIASVIHDGVTLGENCRINGAVICENAVLGNGVFVESGCVIGAGAVISDNTHIFEDVIIPCGANINGEEKSVRIKSGKLFSDEGIEGDFYSFFGIDTLSAIGRAVGSVCRKVGVMYGEESVCELAADAFLCGVRYGSAEAYKSEAVPYTACGCAAEAYGLDIAVHVELVKEPGNIRLRFFDRNGLCPDKSFEDKVVKELYSDSRRESRTPGALRHLGGVRELYENRALSQCPDGLEGIKLCLSETVHTEYFARIAQKAGAKIIPVSERDPEAVYADISADLKSINVKQGNKFSSEPEDFYRLRAIILNSDSSVSSIALPHGMPSDYVKIAEAKGIRVCKFLNCPGTLNKRDEEIRRLWARHPWLSDPFCALLRLLAIMKKTEKSLAELGEQTEKFTVRTEYIKTDDGKKGEVLRALYERDLKENSEYSDSVTVKVKRGEASFLPGKNGLRVIIRSYSAEAASSLAEDIKQGIEKFVNK